MGGAGLSVASEEEEGGSCCCRLCVGTALWPLLLPLLLEPDDPPALRSDHTSHRYHDRLFRVACLD